MHVRVNPTVLPSTPPSAGWLEGRMARVHLTAGSWMVEMAALPPWTPLAVTTRGTPPGLAPWVHLPQVASDPSAAGDPWSCVM